MFTAFNLRCLVHAYFSACDFLATLFALPFLHETSPRPYSHPFFAYRHFTVLFNHFFRLWSVCSLPCSCPLFSVCGSSAAYSSHFLSHAVASRPCLRPFSWLRPLHGIVHIHSARKGTYLFCETKNKIVNFFLFFLNSDAIRFSFLFFTEKNSRRCVSPQ